MTPTLRWSILAVSCGLLHGACTRGASAPPRPRESLLEGAPKAPAFESPAVWRYHPKESAAMLAELQLDQARKLFAGERGERWLETTLPGSPPKVTVEAASDIAPERLTAILRLAEGFGFVGQSGTVYEASEALSPILRSNAPPRGLARVTAQSSVLIGVTFDGGLLRSDDAGVSWLEIRGQPRAVDVVFSTSSRDPKGTALLLTLPEQLFLTKDGGVKWQPLDLGLRGAFQLERTGAAPVVIRELLGSRVFDPVTQTLSDLGRTATSPRVTLGAAPLRGPDAAALEEGRAALGARGYLEVARRDSEWRILAGTFTAPLNDRSLALGMECSDVRLSAFEATLVLACLAEGMRLEARAVTFFRSPDGGTSWEKLPVIAMGLPQAFGFAAGPEGRLVAIGLCEAKRDGACAAEGLQYLRPSTAKGRAKTDAAKATSLSLEFAVSAAPSLGGVPLRVAYSLDGRSVMALGRRSKRGMFAVFVSRDGGKSFVARELSGVDVVDDENSLVRATSFEPAEDGSLAIVLRMGSSRALIVVDDEGRLVTSAKPPDPHALVAAAGHRGLAWSPDTSVAWESLNGGVSWERIGRAPLAPCDSEDDRDCATALQCRIEGCVIGNRLSRIGWQGQEDGAERVTAPPPLMETPPPEGLREGLSCSLRPEPWKPLVDAVEMPSAAKAALGQAAFAVLTDEPEHARVAVLSASRGPRVRLDRDELLPKVDDPRGVAYVGVPQVEGAAALRYVLGQNAGKPELGNVEVAWDNRLLGRRGRARLAGVFPHRSGDSTKGPDGIERPNPALLSVAGNGVYLMLHAGNVEGENAHYIDSERTTDLGKLKWPAIDMARSYLEYVRIENRHVPLRILANGRGLMRANVGSAGPSFDATMTGLADPPSFGLEQRGDLTYYGGALAFHVHTRNAQGVASAGRLFPLRFEGPVTDAPIAVATQRDLAPQPRACRADERQALARLIVPASFGTRHPVVVSDQAEPLRHFLTADAVLHGTPSNACAAAYDAVVVLSDIAGGTRDERALLIMDDLENAWLFRGTARGRVRGGMRSGAPGSEREASSSPDVPGGAGGFEYRRMSCRFDPDFEVPPEVYAALRQAR